MVSTIKVIKRQNIQARILCLIFSTTKKFYRTAIINGVQNNGIAACLKHFAANNQETNRQGVNVCVSERALREIYLKGFEIAVKEAHPRTIMSSYNLINGTYASENYDLLTTLLRKEWGFSGVVMTDWYGGIDAVKQLKAGNDLLMPGRLAQYEQLKAGLKSGALKMKELDVNVRRILSLIKQTPRFKKYVYSNAPRLKEHALVARSSATEGMVLLKNTNALPLNKTMKKVALLGCTSYEFIPGGTGSGNVNGAYTVSLLRGLRNQNMIVDTILQQKYKQYCDYYKKHAKKPEGIYARFLPTPLPDEMEISPEEMSRLAKENDVAIITLGRISGEFVDRSSSDFKLSKNERLLIENACSAFHKQNKKMIVLLNIGGVIETASWKALPDAILCVWQGGGESGNSIVDVLKGKVCPSGKLPMTFPISYTDVPSANNFPTDAPAVEFRIEGVKPLQSGRKNIDYCNYEEDVFVGYRYFDSFNKEVSYPFGYGLSYTRFDYKHVDVAVDGDKINVTLDVINKGKVAGKDVVQLYVQSPCEKEHNKPIHKLKAFAKTKTLNPGETCRISLQMNVDDLSWYDEMAHGWKLDAGEYKLLLGSSSRDIKIHTTLQLNARFNKCSGILSSKKPLNRLKIHS